MRRFEREVTDPVLINEMLKLMDTAYIGVNDADGIPYVVPLSFGYEMTDALLKVYIHTTKAGKKIDLFRRDPRVCVTFSEFNDFPDNKYKGHYHDYRSVIAKGTMKLLDYNDDPAEWEKGYNLLYTCIFSDLLELRRFCCRSHQIICSYIIFRSIESKIK